MTARRQHEKIRPGAPVGEMSPGPSPSAPSPRPPPVATPSTKVRPSDLRGAVVLTEWSRVHGAELAVVWVPPNGVRRFSRHVPGIELQCHRPNGELHHFGLAVTEFTRVRKALEEAEAMAAAMGLATDGDDAFTGDGAATSAEGEGR